MAQTKRRPAPATTAVAKRIPSEFALDKPIRTVQELDAQLSKMAKIANLVTPIAAVDTFPPMHQISLRLVQVDPTYEARGGGGRDVYFDRRFCRPPSGNDKGQVALGKNALLKIMGAAGVQIVSTRRTDPRAIAHYWEWTVSLQGLDYDGAYRQIEASKEVDLRDGAPDTLKPEWACREHGTDTKRCTRSGDRKCWFDKTGRTVALEPAALAEKRKHGAANAETKAILRGLRAYFNLPHVAEVADLLKPFVVPKLVPLLDLDDPDVKAAMIQKAVWGDRILFGPPAADRTTKLVGPEAAPTAAPTRAGTVQALAGAVGVELTPAEAADVAEVAGAPRVVAEPEHDVDAGPPGPDPPPIEGAADPDPPPPLEVEPGPRPEGACTCPCGCSIAPPAVVAAKARKALGTIRCPGCYPDQGFEQAAHVEALGCEGNLDFPRLPDATPALVERWNARRSR